MAEYLNSPPTIELDEAHQQFIVRLPGDKALGHGVRIPINLDGLRLLYDTLRRRNELIAMQIAPVIGTAGGPTQAIIDEFLRAHGATKPEVKERKRSKKELEMDELASSILINL